MSKSRRVLVATGKRCPSAALELAVDLAGDRGEVVLAAILVVPMAQPLDANLAEAVTLVCKVLDQGERELTDAHQRDTRVVRARSFSEGVLETLAAERFDLVLIERLKDVGRGDRSEANAQIGTIIEKAPVTVLIVRPA